MATKSATKRSSTAKGSASRTSSAKGSASKSSAAKGSANGRSAASTSRSSSAARATTSARAAKSKSSGGGSRSTAGAKRPGGKAAARGEAAAKRPSAKRASSAGSQTTTDHDEIRQWAEARGGKPSSVAGTGGGGDPGLIQIDFPGYSGAGKLQEITWDEFFEKFDQNNLALLYQEKTAGGEQSNFNKLVSRETARRKAGRVAGRSPAGRPVPAAGPVPRHAPAVAAGRRPRARPAGVVPPGKAEGRLDRPCYWPSAARRVTHRWAAGTELGRRLRRDRMSRLVRPGSGPRLTPLLRTAHERTT
jgi:hypothetical protein